MQFIRVSPALALAAAAATAALAGSARSADAAVISFDDLPHGTVVTNQYQPVHGVVIDGQNWRGGPDRALIFDTRFTSTADPDLEDPFATGNLSSSILGNGLIIAENIVDADGDFLIDDPDDQAVPVGQGSSGEIVFRFDAMKTSFGFDLLDLDGAEVSSVVGYVSFRRWGVEKARVSLAELTNLASPFYDSTITFGDHSANRISPFSAADLGLSGFNSVAINIASGAVDNIIIDSSTPVPEPTALGTLAMGTLAMLRRQRSAR